jgi:hypothetical protein
VDEIGELCKVIDEREVGFGTPKFKIDSLIPLMRVICKRVDGYSYFEISQNHASNSGGLMKFVDSYQDLRIGVSIMKKYPDFAAEIYESCLEYPYSTQLETRAYSSGLTVTELLGALEINMKHFETLEMFFVNSPQWANQQSKSSKLRESIWSDEKQMAKLKEKYVAALQMAATFEYPLSGNKYDQLVKAGQIDAPGKQTIAKFFGTWRNACAVAGVEAKLGPNRVYLKKWSKDEMIQIVVQCAQSIGHAPSLSEYQTWAFTQDEVPSLATLKNEFRTWDIVKATVAKRFRD